MSHIIEQGPVHSGGLTIDGYPAQILLTRRQQLTPPAEIMDFRVSNGNDYNNLSPVPELHSTKQKIIRGAIKTALTHGHEVGAHVDESTATPVRYESVDGVFKLVGPFVVGSSKVVKRVNGITDTYNYEYQKHSIGRIGLKGVLGIPPTPLWKRAHKSLQTLKLAVSGRK